MQQWVAANSYLVFVRSYAPKHRNFGAVIEVKFVKSASIRARFWFKGGPAGG
jgi:hypothetical protein